MVQQHDQDENRKSDTQQQSRSADDNRKESQSADYLGESQNIDHDESRRLDEEELKHSRNKANESQNR